MPKPDGLPKPQRLTGRTAVNRLFQRHGSHTITCHPLVAVYRPNHHATHRILVSAPKRHLRHAVDRNHAKRQMREGYRHHRPILHDLPTHLDIALIWNTPSHHTTAAVTAAIAQILHQIHTTLCTPSAPL